MTDFSCDDCITENYSHYDRCGFVNVYGICLGKKKVKND